MFEHEQHDAWLLGRRARDTAQGVLAKRTRRIDPSPVGRPTQRATRLRISQTNTTNQRTMIFCPNKANYLRKRSQSGKSNENNVLNRNKPMLACLAERTRTAALFPLPVLTGSGLG